MTTQPSASTRSPFDTGSFRKALGSFTTGVTVVTTRGGDGGDVGLTANSFNSVSLDPPMVLWSLAKSAMSMEHFRAASYFAVHILAEDQQSLSGVFATRGIDKFQGIDLARGPGDIPLLEHCAARFICKTAYQYEGGDHIIFVGEVVDFSNWDRKPLLFHAGQYGQLLKNAVVAADDGGEYAEASLGFLLRYCSHQLLAPLKRELGNHRISIAQYYFLAMLAKYGPDTLDGLLMRAEQGDNRPTREEIDDLVSRGYLRHDGDQLQLTPTGARLHMELVAFYKSSEGTALNQLDYDMRQALQIALARLASGFSPHHR